MRRRRSGVTAVEVCAVVCVVGILLAIVVPAFVREARLSKTAEAAQLLETLYQRSAAYFAAEHEGNGEGPPLRRCLPVPAGPTPRQPSPDGELVAFADPERAGAAPWEALGFQPEVPVRYSYTFEPTTPGCGLRAPEGTYLVTFRAEGDLDGDGERSLLERRATATPEGDLVPFGILYVRDRVE
ncbi:MAG: type II secretion system protein [Sandaracinaceae bacterium]